MSTEYVSRQAAKELDPATWVAQALAQNTLDDVPLLRRWRGDWFLWTGGCYRDLSNDEARTWLIGQLNATHGDVTTRIVANMEMQLEAQVMLPSSMSAPAWLGSPPAGCEHWQPGDLLVAKNGILHLPTLAGILPRPTFLAELAANQPMYYSSLTPKLLTTVALDYDFAYDAPPPTLWLQFLQQLWPDDVASRELLQEWFGYCLGGDTSQQKILMLVGPTRCGKGTIARVLRRLLGEANVAGPTLAGLTTNFGLASLLGKSLAIIPDARLSGRADQQAIVVERLLSISGQDAITIDRKHKSAVTVTLPTRLMMLLNELPRLADASGAVANRFGPLQFTRSWLGNEDTGLTEKLCAELPGILLWSIIGWQRLRQRGRFVLPAGSGELIEDIATAGSPIAAFIRERCEVRSDVEVERRQLYRVYQGWCREQDRHPVDVAEFGRGIAAAVPQPRRVQRGSGRERYRVYSGLRVAAC